MQFQSGIRDHFLTKNQVTIITHAGELSEFFFWSAWLTRSSTKYLLGRSRLRISSGQHMATIIIYLEALSPSPSMLRNRFWSLQANSDRKPQLNCERTVNRNFCDTPLTYERDCESLWRIHAAVMSAPLFWINVYVVNSFRRGTHHGNKLWTTCG